MTSGPNRRQWLQGTAGLGLAPAWASAAGNAKVLRIAFATAETGFDPTQVNDIYSRSVTAHIFEALYAFDHLARPARIRPLTAEGLPQVSEDFLTWTFRVRQGIFFADDPAFAGRRRELVAEDYVYAIKRYADPKLKSPLWGYTDSYGLLGLAEARQRAIDGKRAFDYDTPIEGLRTLDRYTLQIRLREPRPRLLDFIAASDLYGAVAREVVEHYGEQLTEHPVGTGPFVLAQWRRASRIVLARNPQYRERVYDAEPAADDAEGQALLARFKGRRLPMIDRVEIDIVEEAQPRWLAFLGGEHDHIDRVPAEFISQAVLGNALAPHLVKRGVHGRRALRADYHATFFNMEDPLVGGYTPDKVALRRAISLGMDVEREIRIVHRGQGLACQSPYCPESTAWRPGYKSEMGDFDPARAQALLDLYGYVDRDGDGWREQPDGSPLSMVWSIETTQRSRQISEQYLRDMTRLGLRIEFKVGKWPELVKAARAGQFQVWHIGNQAATPDSLGQLTRYDSRQRGSQNFARFKRPEMDALFDRLARMPDGPDRLAGFAEAARIAAVWMPYRVRFHTIQTWLAHRPVIGYRPPPFWQEWWHMVDVVR